MGDKIRERYNQHLMKVLALIPDDYILIIGGDFNARVGVNWERDDREELVNMSESVLRDNRGGGMVMGDYTDDGEPLANHNGQLLIEMCQELNYAIVTTFHKGCHQTWRHARSGKWATLDHVVTRQRTYSGSNIVKCKRICILIRITGQ